MPAVDDLGEEGGPRHAFEGELPRSAHLRRVVFDGDREDDAIEIARDGASIVGSHLDAERAELVGDVAVLALIEGAVGALDLMPASAHQPRQRIHAGAGDTGEVVAHDADLTVSRGEPATCS